MSLRRLAFRGVGWSPAARPRGEPPRTGRCANLNPRTDPDVDPAHFGCGPWRLPQPHNEAARVAQWCRRPTTPVDHDRTGGDDRQRCPDDAADALLALALVRARARSWGPGAVVGAAARRREGRVAELGRARRAQSPSHFVPVGFRAGFGSVLAWLPPANRGRARAVHSSLHGGNACHGPRRR